MLCAKQKLDYSCALKKLTIVMQIKVTKVAAVVTGLAMATSMLSLAPMAHAASLSDSQVQSILSLLSSFGANSATIANVQAALTGQPSTTPSVPVTTSSISKDLTIGSTGADVKTLQNGLIAKGYMTGSATGYFGAITQKAVIAWQKAAGISPAAGYFGAKSRAVWGGVVTNPTNPTNPTVPVGSGNGLKISLSASSPNGTVLVQGQGIGDLGDYVFANPTASPINVTALNFKRTGVSNDATLNNVYLYNGATRLTDSAGVSGGAFNFSSAVGLFTVPAGQAYTVSVRSDIAGSTSGQQIGVSLVSASSSGTLDSSVSFPVNSGYQTISAANLATVSFGATTLPNSSATIAPQSSYAIWQNTVSVSTNPVKLAGMTFTSLGSIDSASIGNFRLYVDGVQAGNAVPSFTSGRTVVFDLSANPMTLSTQSHIIKVLADITGGASYTFQLSLQRSSDAMFVDSQLNQPVTPVSGGSSTNFSAVNAAQMTVQYVSGSTGISVSKDPTSATNSVSVGATNVNFATYNMLASGENTKVMDLYVCAVTKTSGYTGAGGGLANGKIYVNGTQVGSTKAVAECGVGTTDFGLGSSLILPAGQTTLVSVYADANVGVATSTVSAGTNIPTGNQIKVRLVGQTSNGTNAQGQASLNSAAVPVSDTDGNAITLASAGLTASKYAGYANQTITPGSNNALIGEFTLAAGSTEGINVNTIGINASSTWNAYLQNLTLKNMATGAQIGTTISTPSEGTNSFSLGSNLAIPMSGSVTVGIYANLLSTAASVTGSTALAVSSAGTSGTGAVTGTSASLTKTVMLQSISAASGTLTVSVGASNPVAANVIAGASSLQVGDFQFSANNSSYTIHKLQVDVPNTAATALTSVTLKDGSNVLGTLTGASAVGSATTTYAFTGLSDVIASGNQADISVWVGVTTVASGGAAISGQPIVVALNHNTNFEAQDQSGTLTTSFTADVNSNSNSGYGTLVVRKSIPTFTMLASGTATPATGQSLYKFSIAADPSNPVDVDQVSFTVATTSATLTSFKLLDISSGSAVQIGGTQTAVTAGVVTFNLGANPQQIGAGLTKTYELIATVTGWDATGDAISINLTQDTTALSANGYSTDGALTGSNIIWSDRSATGHAAGGVGTGTQDWTNGYLLKDFVTNTKSYSYGSSN